MSKTSERADLIAAEDGAVRLVREESMADLDSVDVTDEEALTVDGFNLEQWVAGVRPTRRATVVYARADLLAQIDVLAERAVVAKAAGDDVEVASLAAQVADIRGELEASGLDVVVEATSETVRGRLREDLGIVDGEQPTEEQTCAFIAAHIVEPPGFTGAMVEAINRVSPHQVMKIASAMRIANETAPSIPAPFSPASSSGRRARG